MGTGAATPQRTREKQTQYFRVREAGRKEEGAGSGKQHRIAEAKSSSNTVLGLLTLGREAES